MKTLQLLTAAVALAAVIMGPALAQDKPMSNDMSAGKAAMPMADTKAMDKKMGMPMEKPMADKKMEKPMSDKAMDKPMMDKPAGK